jgi:hypothetical protein
LKQERDEARAESEEQARLLGKGGEREARRIAERDEAREALAEWHDSALHVDSDHPDEVHCGCVAVLRKQLADARLSVKHALEAECCDCATLKQERDEARAEACETHKLLLSANQDAYEARAEAARLQMELDGMCNAEELRQARAEVARLKAENELFRDSQMFCEGCDEPTMKEHRELKAEVARLKNEIRPLRELVGVDARAISALSDIQHWRKLMDAWDENATLKAEVARLRGELKRIAEESECDWAVRVAEEALAAVQPATNCYHLCSQQGGDK